MRSPDEVAATVIRAVKKNPAEIAVAAFEQSFAAMFAGINHALASSLQRRLGGEQVSRQIAATEAHKR